MFGLNPGVMFGDSIPKQVILSIDQILLGVDRYDEVSIDIEEVYASAGIILEGVRKQDALSYALGHMSGEEACDLRKRLERDAGAVSEEDLVALYGKLDRVRRFVRRIPGNLKCV